MALTDLQGQLALQAQSVQLDLMEPLVLQVLLVQALQEQPVFKVPLAPKALQVQDRQALLALLDWDLRN
jgi:hypothetical protein